MPRHLSGEKPCLILAAMSKATTVELHGERVGRFQQRHSGTPRGQDWRQLRPVTMFEWEDHESGPARRNKEPPGNDRSGEDAYATKAYTCRPVSLGVAKASPQRGWGGAVMKVIRPKQAAQCRCGPWSVAATGYRGCAAPPAAERDRSCPEQATLATMMQY